MEEQFNKARAKIGNRLSISKYLKDKGVVSEGESKGKICCPVHSENSPSFFYDDDKGDFHCFGCHAKGSVVELHWNIEKRKNERYTIYSAVKDLSKKYNIEIPDLYKIDYEEIMSKPKREIRKRGKKRTEEEERDYYINKLIGLEGRYNVMPYKMKLLISYSIDKVWLGREDAKGTYKKIKGIIDKFNQRQVDKELKGTREGD